VTNLVLNARDAVRGHGQITVSAAARRGDLDQVEICVEDDGVGVDAETRDRIFDPFFSTKEIGEGTGLGLAIVFGIVTNHGGEVAVESRPEGGSRFTTSWPAAHDVGQPAPKAAPTTAPAVSIGEILVVEDEAPVRRVVRAALEQAGFDVLEAKSGAEAIALTQGRVASLALAIVDMNMPGLSGPETIDQLTKEHPELPSILMSGHLPDRSDLGAAHDLAKPFRSRELLRAVRDALDSA
jgi:CheY-like chemotaxis protein